MAVIAVADLHGIAGRRDELVALLQRAEREAAGKTGCQRYTFSVALRDPDQFLLVSEWDTQEALEAHYRSDAFTNFQLGLDGLLARPSELTVYAAEGAIRPQNTRPMDPRDAD